MLLEDVQECVAQTVEVVQSYKNRNMVSRAFVSPLCKRRLGEAGVAIMLAVQRLQVGTKPYFDFDDFGEIFDVCDIIRFLTDFYR